MSREFPTGESSQNLRKKFIYSFSVRDSSFTEGQIFRLENWILRISSPTVTAIWLALAHCWIAYCNLKLSLNLFY